jgi:hypothetical protein
VGAAGGAYARGPGGVTAVGSRGGVAVGPAGGVAVARAAVGHATGYISPVALRTSGANLRAGFQSTCFTGDWYRGHAAAWVAPRWRAANFWAAPAWSAVSDWCGVADAPIGYDYGTSVVINDDNVYVNGDQVASAEQYAEQATTFADRGRDAKPEAEEQWQSLGVFGMIQGDEKTPEYVLQLAVNQAGILRGNYYDAVADNTTPVYGSVDRKTQRVAWSIGVMKTVVYEAGLNNLTQEQTTVLVHYGKAQTREMVLVRLEEPRSDGKE